MMKIFKGGRTTCITNLRLACDIDANAEERGLEVLVKILDKTCTRYVVVVLLFYVHGKHLRSCRDGQST